MGFLTNIFKSKENKYLESFVSELKQDKTLLQKEVIELREENKALKEFNINLSNKLLVFKDINIKKKKQKLSPLQNKIYTSYLKHRPKNMTELSKFTKVKESSLRVYCSTINKKVDEPISFR